MPIKHESRRLHSRDLEVHDNQKECNNVLTRSYVTSYYMGAYEEESRIKIIEMYKKRCIRFHQLINATPFAGRELVAARTYLVNSGTLIHREPPLPYNNEYSLCCIEDTFTTSSNHDLCCTFVTTLRYLLFCRAHKFRAFCGAHSRQRLSRHFCFYDRAIAQPSRRLRRIAPRTPNYRTT